MPEASNSKNSGREGVRKGVDLDSSNFIPLVRGFPAPDRGVLVLGCHSSSARVLAALCICSNLSLAAADAERRVLERARDERVGERETETVRRRLVGPPTYTWRDRQDKTQLQGEEMKQPG